MAEYDAAEDFPVPDSMHIITLVCDSESASLPRLDLGSCPPWLALNLLQSALDTVQALIPPVDVVYDGQLIVSGDIELLDGDDDDS